MNKLVGFSFSLIVYVLLFFVFPNLARAQGDCDPYADHVNLPVYVIDQANQRWGVAGNTCGIPTSQTPVNASKAGVSPNYIDSVTWSCDSNGSRVTGGAFIARSPRCFPGTQPMVVDVQPPAGFTCGTWTYVGVGNGFGNPNNTVYSSGTGCRVSVPIPPYNNDGSRDVERQVFVRVQPINPDPIGYCDAVTCNSFTGWTCDPSDYNRALGVHFYADDLSDSNPAFIVGSITASLPREPGVAAACGGNPNHGYNFNTPASLKDGGTYRISAYAINTPSGNNPVLSNCPQTISCGATCAVPEPVTYVNPPTCTADTTPTLTIRDQGVNCYPHDSLITVRRDNNNNDTYDGNTTTEPIMAGTSIWADNTIPATLQTASISPTLTGGTNYIWRALVRTNSGGLLSPQTGWNNLDIDTLPPPVPVPALTFNVNGTVRVSWTGVTDAGCGGNVQYWSQITTNSPSEPPRVAYPSIWPPNNTWQNGWRASTNQTSTIACTAGQRYYVHVRSRDGLDNQSAWSASVSGVCPLSVNTSTPTPSSANTPTPIISSCPLAIPPLPAVTCAQRTNSPHFNVTVNWNDTQPACTLPHEFNAQVSTNSSFPSIPVGFTDSSGFQPGLTTFTSTNNGAGYPAGNSIHARVQVDDGSTTQNSPRRTLTLGCPSAGGNCTCGMPTPTPGAVSGMLRYCPQPPLP